MVFFYILLFLFLAAALTDFAIRPGTASAEKKAPFYGRNFAHRGLHTPDKSAPENSLLAFRRAADAGYGVELDIQLSKDGQVVVFHDDTLDRVCGVHGRVDAFTFDELREMRLAGSAQQIPLLTEVFEVIDAKGPIIIELKSGPRNAELCKKGLELMRAYHGAYCVESFDPRIVQWFKKNAPEILRGQLATLPGEYHAYPRIAGTVMGNCLSNFLGRPEFIAYDNAPKPLLVQMVDARGALRVLWTARDAADAKRVQHENDMVIFEFYEPCLQYKSL